MPPSWFLHVRLIQSGQPSSKDDQDEEAIITVTIGAYPGMVLAVGVKMAANNGVSRQQQGWIRDSRASNRGIMLLGVLYLIVYILPLGHRPLILPDETRYFEIPREMIATGDWIVPRLDGLNYFEKPVLGYWANAVSMLVFGKNAFAIRFPAALSVGIMAMVLFFAVRRDSEDMAPAWLAAAIFLSSLEIVAIGTFGVLDSLFTMFLTTAMFSFFHGFQATRPRQQIKWLLLSGVLFGAGFLTKGFIAFAVPGLIIVAYTVWEGRFGQLIQKSWVPLGAALATVLPWGIAIHLREGDFWHYFFWVEHIQRFLRPGNGQHPEAFWFFIPVILAGTLPWSATLPAAVQGLRKTTATPLVRFSICWFSIAFLFFSASSGKLTTYILPCFPPVAVLMAIGLWRCLKKEQRRAYRLGANFLGGVILLMAVGLAVVQSVPIIGSRPYGPDETWKWLLACTGLGVWGVSTLWSATRSSPSKKLQGHALAGVVFFTLSAFIFPDVIYAQKAPAALLMRNRHWVSPDTVVVADGYLIRSACAYLNRQDIRLFVTSDELSYGIHHFPPEARRMLDGKTLAQLIDNRERENRSVAIIMREDKHRRYRDLLPTPKRMDRYGRFTFMLY